MRPPRLHPRRPRRRARGGGGMKTVDLVSSAVRNAFRSKTRTILTMLAIFIGAFTLSLTNGLGTGINRYIDDTVASDRRRRRHDGHEDARGRADRRRATTASTTRTQIAGRPARPGRRRHRPHRRRHRHDRGRRRRAERRSDARSSSADYVQHDDGTKYQLIGVGSSCRAWRSSSPPGSSPTLDAADPQLVLPESLRRAAGPRRRRRRRSGRRSRSAVTDADRARSTSSTRPSSASPSPGPGRR